jgi:TolB protein
MSVDGFDQVALTTNTAGDFRPAWSPDSSQIAFVSNRTGRNAIYVMNSDGSNQRLLFETTDGNITSLDW